MKRTLNKAIANMKIQNCDPFWQSIHNKRYRLYLIYWKAISEVYNSVGSVGNVGSEGSDIGVISGHSLELWKPIFANLMVGDHRVEPKGLADLSMT